MRAKMILRKCPFCHENPKVELQIHNRPEEWKWQIRCNADECSIRPETKIVAIRNTTKRSLGRIAGKLEHLAQMWNSGYDGQITSYAEINLDPLKLDA